MLDVEQGLAIYCKLTRVGMQLKTTFKMNPSEPPGRDLRRALGKAANEEGHAFEGRVADLYRLMHYDVEHGRIFEGRQVDLLLTGEFGDVTLRRAVECKLGAVRSEHVDSFVAKLRLIRRTYPPVHGTIISAVSFTDTVAAHAAAEGIQLVLYRDLTAKLLDGHSYAKNLVSEVEGSAHYPWHNYVQPLIAYELGGPAIDATTVIDSWLRASDWRQLTLLGDVGTGKSFLCRALAHRLATAYLRDPINEPLPILIDLRNADREFSLEGLILTHFARTGLKRASYEAFRHALSEGTAVLILDGFDEMSVRVTQEITQRNFIELMNCVRGRAKVLLTCRTHYFKSRSEEEEVILGVSSDFGSNASAKELYWDLISRTGFRIGYLTPFTLAQIEEYVSRVRPRSARDDLYKIRSTYNLIELAQRPMLLDMIVKSLDKMGTSEINASVLYTVYTDAWVFRDKWRDALSSGEKRNFLIALATFLWMNEDVSVHYTKLSEFARQYFADESLRLQHMAAIDSDIRTATFLTRDRNGHYGFAHKSYAEFFLARFLAERLNKRDVSCLTVRRLTPEVISFLRHLVELAEVECLLEEILCDSYTPSLSENALVCLYNIRRGTELERISSFHDVPSSGIHDEFVIDLPDNVILRGAQLAQVVLEGASLVGADFTDAKLDGAILTGADLERTCFQSASLRLADLSTTICRGANFERTDLTGCNLMEADLTDVVIDSAHLTDVLFSGAVAHEEVLETLRQSYTSIDASTRGGDLPSPLWLSTLLAELDERMIKIAKVVGVPGYLEAQDIPSEVLVRLAQRKRLKIIDKLDRSAQRAYVISFTVALLEQLNAGEEGWDEGTVVVQGVDHDRDDEYDYLDGTWSEFYYKDAAWRDDWWFPDEWFDWDADWEFDGVYDVPDGYYDLSAEEFVAANIAWEQEEYCW